MFAYSYTGSMPRLGTLIGALTGLFPSALIAIASYVLSSLALYTMAVRRGIHNPWLSWVPVVRVWILGSLSDQYRYVVRGENRSKRKSLIGLSVLSALAGFAVTILAGSLVVQIVYGIFRNASSAWMMEAINGPLMGLLGLSLPVLAIAIARAVIYYMALYDVYKSMDPANTVVFLVLSILFHVTEPFFLFFNRTKDLGMPPRRDAARRETWDEE